MEMTVVVFPAGPHAANLGACVILELSVACDRDV